MSHRDRRAAFQSRRAQERQAPPPVAPAAPTTYRASDFDDLDDSLHLQVIANQALRERIGFEPVMPKIQPGGGAFTRLPVPLTGPGNDS